MGGRGGGGESCTGGRGKEGEELEVGVIRLGFLNCRGWWSREVDVNLVLQQLDLDIFGLAETFLRKGEEPQVGGYKWYGNNRKACKRASGGVGLLVRDGLQARTLKDETEGVLWVEVKLEDEGKVTVGVVYANPEGVRSEETEVQFEKVLRGLKAWLQYFYHVF